MGHNADTPAPNLPNHGADSIAAIATARGRSALAVIRVSGPDAVSIAARCFDGGRSLADVEPNTAHFGYAIQRDRTRIDQIVATVFRAPRSATGEDTVEFSCHGGDVAARLILERLLEAGARLAEAGEFTQRAFLNGKVDLAQAEAVADLIHASSTLAHRVSLQQLTGRYSLVLQTIRTELLDVAALIELELDFSDEDVEFADKDKLVSLLQQATVLLKQLLGSYRTGRIVRDGVRVVIGGKPNAGKSTLLNSLVGFDRAIVSPTPGTTRDEVEAEAEINGVLFHFVDTAGLRNASDEIEAEGVRRAHRALEEADVVLYVIDGSVGTDEAELEYVGQLDERLGPLPLLVVLNKSDVVSDREPISIAGAMQISALQAGSDSDRLSPLVQWLTESIGADLSLSDGSPVVTNQRHRQHLQQAQDAIDAVLAGLERNLSGDMLSVDLRRALYEIGAITGEITNEDVLGQIFSRFCIGK